MCWKRGRGYIQNMRKTVLSGLKATSSRFIPTSCFTSCRSQPSGIGSLCILGCHIGEHRATGSQQGRRRGNFLSPDGGGIYLGLALQVGLAESFYRPRIQRLRGQVVGHMVCHVDQPDEGSLEHPNPEVFHQPAVARLLHVHKHKQDLKCAKHTNICFLIVICLCFGSMVDVSVLL